MKRNEQGASRVGKGEGKFIVAHIVGTPGNQSVYPIDEYTKRADADWHVRDIKKYDVTPGKNGVHPEAAPSRAVVLEVGKDIERVITYKLPGAANETGRD